MRLFVAAILAAVGMSGPAFARDPITGLVESFFNYEAPRPPPVGNCAAIATEIGAGSTWFGEFSGERWMHNDRFEPFASRGCFDSEIACRIWQQQALTYADGAISYMSCRPRIPG